MKFLAVTALLLAAIAPSAAQSATGMSAMQYYVGTWSCVAGAVGRPQSKATATYTLDQGVLREWVAVPKQGKMTAPYVYQSATVYDAKAGKYVQSTLDSEAAWSISTAKPWSGSTEVWYDRANSTGKLSRGDSIRTNQNSFTFHNYPSASSTKPNFAGSCTRTS